MAIRYITGRGITYGHTVFHRPWNTVWAWNNVRPGNNVLASLPSLSPLTSTQPTAATFISFLLEVDSVYEVHDYIKSYLGETNEAHDFAKQFLERRQRVKRPAQQSSQVSSTKNIFAFG